MDVRKKPISPEQALKLVKKQRVLHAASGSKIVSINLAKDKPSDEQLLKLIIGRSGTMRAPCLQVDDVFVAGFNADLYKDLLKL